MTDRHQILCLDGDGISTELVASLKIIDAALTPYLLKPINLIHDKVGFSSLKVHGTTITNAVVEQAKSADGVILGPVSHNDYPAVEAGGLNPSGVLRKALSLFANIRPAYSYQGILHPIAKKIDVVVMRENLEGFYADRNMAEGSGEFSPVDGVALAVRKITAKASEDIARASFEYAQTRGRKKVTAIHKANVMRMTDGLFLHVVRQVARQFPEITYDEMLVDAATAMLVRAPEQFDVIVTTNMFGDILSDLTSELAGGLGLAGSLNLGHNGAMAQAQHGSAPDIAGQDKANPVSLLLSFAMLLEHLGEGRASGHLKTQMAEMIAQPQTRTADLGGMLSCSDFAYQLAKRLS